MLLTLLCTFCRKRDSMPALSHASESDSGHAPPLTRASLRERSHSVAACCSRALSRCFLSRRGMKGDGGEAACNVSNAAAAAVVAAVVAAAAATAGDCVPKVYPPHAEPSPPNPYAYP